MKNTLPNIMDVIVDRESMKVSDIRHMHTPQNFHKDGTDFVFSSNFFEHNYCCVYI